MDPNTEIAANFTVGDYLSLRESLSSTGSPTSAWDRLIRVFQQRINERFLRPIDALFGLDDTDFAARPGFAIMTLDCLLIDTLQSFREGRTSTGESSTAKSFLRFLNSAPAFAAWSRRDKNKFYSQVRNALFHNGETRGNWKIRRDTMKPLTEDGDSRILNRNLFHDAICSEYERFCSELGGDSEEMRSNFLKRMNALCGITSSSRNYFAYGSNLLGEEIETVAPKAEEVGRGYVTLYTLAFNKHSVKRKGDAANIIPNHAGVVWGFIYRVSGEEWEALKRRVWVRRTQSYSIPGSRRRGKTTEG